MVLLGDKDLGTCSKVTAVGRIRAERRTTAKPWGPWKAQQLPGCTSGWRGRKSGQRRGGHEDPSPSAAPADPGWDSHSATQVTVLRALIDPCRVLTWRMTRGDWEWYHRGMPKRLRSAVLVS